MAAVAGDGCVTADGVMDASELAPAAAVPVPNYNTIDVLQTCDSNSSNYNMHSLAAHKFNKNTALITTTIINGNNKKRVHD